MNDKNFVIHEYDPVKRRDYYLKTRQLKGHVPHPTQKSIDAESEPNRQQGPRTRVAETKARLEKVREALSSKTRLGVRSLTDEEVESLAAKIKTIQERIAKMRSTSSAGATNTQNKK